MPTHGLYHIQAIAIVVIDIIDPIIALIRKKMKPVSAAKNFPKRGKYDIIIVIGEKNKSTPTPTKQQPINLVAVVTIELKLNLDDMI